MGRKPSALGAEQALPTVRHEPTPTQLQVGFVVRQLCNAHMGRGHTRAPRHIGHCLPGSELHSTAGQGVPCWPGPSSAKSPDLITCRETPRVEITEQWEGDRCPRTEFNSLGLLDKRCAWREIKWKWLRFNESIGADSISNCPDGRVLKIKCRAEVTCLLRKRFFVLFPQLSSSLSCHFWVGGPGGEPEPQRAMLSGHYTKT